MRILSKLFSYTASKTTPIDADFVVIKDSTASDVAKVTTWANIKATLKTYFDTLYQVILISGTNIRLLTVLRC